MPGGVERPGPLVHDGDVAEIRSSVLHALDLCPPTGRGGGTKVGLEDDPRAPATAAVIRPTVFRDDPVEGFAELLERLAFLDRPQLTLELSQLGLLRLQRT